MRRLHRNRLFQIRGFTLTEIAIILFLVGVLSAIAVPGFASMLDAVKLKHATAEIQTNFSHGQRQAIRKRELCRVGILSSHTSVRDAASPLLFNDCVAQGDQLLSDKIRVVSNLTPVSQDMIGVVPDPVDPEDPMQISPDLDEDTRDWCEGHQDHWEKRHEEEWPQRCLAPPPSQPSSPLPLTQVSEVAFGHQGTVIFDVHSNDRLPIDSTGKIIVYTRGKADQRKNCIAVSRRIGLTRLGAYSGELDPKDITDTGVCKAQEWQAQTQ